MQPPTFVAIRDGGLRWWRVPGFRFTMPASFLHDWPPPWPWRIAYCPGGYDAVVFAPIGLHLLYRWWYFRVSIVFGTLARLGLWDGREGDYYLNGRLTVPWRSSYYGRRRRVR